MLVFSPNHSLNRQFSLKEKVFNHIGWYLGYKGMNIAQPPNPLMIFSLPFLHIFQNFKFIWEKTEKC